MANNNTKRRKALKHKQQRKDGFPKSGFKAKSKPFPKPDKETDLSMVSQIKTYYGSLAK